MEKTNTPPLPRTDRQIVSGGSGLIFPNQLSRKEADRAEQMLGAISQNHQQAILDVLAASIEAGSIRKSALACLGGLIRRFKSDSFDSTPGLHIAERWLLQNPIRFSSPAVKRRFLRHIARDSGGVPATLRYAACWRLQVVKRKSPRLKSERSAMKPAYDIWI